MVYELLTPWVASVGLFVSLFGVCLTFIFQCMFGVCDGAMYDEGKTRPSYYLPNENWVSAERHPCPQFTIPNLTDSFFPPSHFLWRERLRESIWCFIWENSTTDVAFLRDLYPQIRFVLSDGAQRSHLPHDTCTTGSASIRIETLVELFFEQMVIDSVCALSGHLLSAVFAFLNMSSPCFLFFDPQKWNPQCSSFSPVVIIFDVCRICTFDLSMFCQRKTKMLSDM